MKKAKLLSYILFILFLFSFCRKVNAAYCNDSAILHDGQECDFGVQSVDIGGNLTFLTNRYLTDVTCNSTDHFNITYVSESNRLDATVKSGAVIREGDATTLRDAVSCVGTFRNVETGDHGTITIKGGLKVNVPTNAFKFEHAFRESHPTLILSRSLAGSSKIVTIKSLTTSDSLDGIEFTDCSNSSYVAGKECRVTVTNFDPVRTIRGTMSYYHPDDPDVVIEGQFTFEIAGDIIKVRVNGNCDASSWTNLSGNDYYKSKESVTSLPTCEANPASEPYKEFKGYLSSDSDFPHGDDNCTGAVMNPTGSQIKAFNYACYKTSKYIILQPNGGTISDTSSYQYLFSQYYYIGSSLTLPTITPPSDQQEFLYWSNTNDSDSHNPGESVSVPSDQEYLSLKAIFKDKGGAAGSTQFSLSLKLHETVEIKDYYGLDISSVNKFISSDTSKVSTSSSGGYYYVFGAGATSTPVNVTLEYKDSSNKVYTVILKVIVSESETYGYEDPVEEEIPEEELPYDPIQPTVTGTTIGGVVAGTASGCDQGYIVKDTKEVVTIFYYKGDDNKLLKYKAENKCDGQTYDAICLDPGSRGAPKAGKLYYLAEKMGYAQIDPSKGGWDAGVEYLAGVIYDSPSKYYEVNFATRVLTYKYNLGQHGGKFSSHCQAYQTFANSTSEDGTYPSSPSGWNITGTGASIIAGSQSMYKEALNAAKSNSGGGGDESGDGDGELKVEDVTHSSEWDGHTFVYTQSGRITSTGNIKVEGLEQACGSPYSCEVVSTQQSGNDLIYTIKLRVTITSTTIAPNADYNLTKFKIKISGNSGSSGSAFLLYKATETSTYQRFIVFHPSGGGAYLYVKLEDGDCKFFTDALNDGCSTDAECAKVNEDWWFFLNCCKDVTNKDSFAYEYFCEGEDCFSENYLNECEYPDNNSTGFDIYSVREAENKAGVKKYKCIVAVSKKCSRTNNDCDDKQKREATEKKRDLVGNPYAIEDFESNRYCRVSCKEDWFIGSPSFGNFTGDHAVQAGSYFMIDKPLYIGTTRTCVTTKINYKQYAQDVEAKAHEVVNNWNKYNYYRYKYQQLLDGKDKGYTCEGTKVRIHNYTGYHREDGDCIEWDKKNNCTKHADDWHNYYDTMSDCYNWTFTIKPISGGCVAYNHDGTIKDAYDDEGECRSGHNPAGDSHYTESKTNTTGDHRNPGSCTTTTSKDDMTTCTELYNLFEKEISGYVETYRNEVERLIGEIDAMADQFAKCQNFILYVDKGPFRAQDSSGNYSTEMNIVNAYSSGLGYTTVDSVVSHNVKSIGIKSAYSPVIQYSYDEREYMKILVDNEENYMTAYLNENNKYISEYMKSNNTHTAISNYKDDLDRQLYLARNYYAMDKYDPEDPDSVDESIYNPDPTKEGARTLAEADESVQIFGNADAEDSLGIKKFSLCKTESGNGKIVGGTHKCALGMFNYYKAYYIKQTLSNSSFFKNYGDWYINNLTDVKVHDDTLESSTRISDPDNWSLLGGHNVFPISMDTKKNLYKYEYKFFNIGMYKDGSLGRIMGGEVSAPDGYTVVNAREDQTLIDKNYHDCVYEVYESICRCCGDDIETYATFYETNPDYVEGYNTVEYVNSTGATPGVSYNTEINEAQIGAYTNTVSLSNVASATQRVLGANWKAQTPFYLAGTVHAGSDGTNQGAYLLKGIEEKGDELYNEKPEYSYTLNPSILANMRNYNKSNSYVPDLAGGKFTAAEGEGNGTGFKHYGSGEVGWIVSNADADNKLRFFHYKSKYLRETLKDYETPGNGTSFSHRTKVCYVTGTESELELKVKNLVTNGPGTECLWVDYVTPSEKIRLAFK